VSEGGKLEMELRIKRGRGYVSADKILHEDLGIGWIPHRLGPFAGQKVKLRRRGGAHRPDDDYDKLTLEVWTNGAVPPRERRVLAAKLTGITSHLRRPRRAGDQPLRGLGDQTSSLLNEHLDKSVEELELSCRSYNCL